MSAARALLAALRDLGVRPSDSVRCALLRETKRRVEAGEEATDAARAVVVEHLEQAAWDQAEAAS